MVIAYMEELGYSRANIRTFTSALSYLHKMRGLADLARVLVMKMLHTVGGGQVRRDMLPICEYLLLRMVKMTNRRWNVENNNT